MELLLRDLPGDAAVKGTFVAAVWRCDGVCEVEDDLAVSEPIALDFVTLDDGVGWEDVVELGFADAEVVVGTDLLEVYVYDLGVFFVHRVEYSFPGPLRRP